MITVTVPSTSQSEEVLCVGWNDGHLSPKRGLCVADHPVLNEVDVTKDDVVSVIRIHGLSASGPWSFYTKLI